MKKINEVYHHCPPYTVNNLWDIWLLYLLGVHKLVSNSYIFAT